MFKLRKFRSKQAQAKYRALLVERAQIALALVGALLLLFSQLSFIPGITIMHIEVVGNVATEDAALRRVVAEEISGYALNLFSRSNSFFFSRNAIESAIHKQFPRISDVDADFVNRHTIRVTVAERGAVGVVCAPSPTSIVAGYSTTTSVVSTATACYVLDASGYIFSETAILDTYGAFIYYGPTNTVASTTLPRAGSLVGRQFVTPQLFQEMTTLGEAFTDIDLMVVSISVYETYLEYVMEDGLHVLVNDDPATFTTQLQNLETVINSEELNNATTSPKYIDLRFGNKVFYK